ncbi:MAG: hypothetical protein ACKVHO_07975 [Verrucomicrobiia bacterium]|jgi:hypothetical protein
MRSAAIIGFLIILTTINAWMNWQLWHAPKTSRPRPPAIIERDIPVKQIGQNKIFRPQRDETHASPPWAYLESEDYLEFAANLRAAEVPERTIRDILIADMSRNYEEQLNALAEQEPDTFWLNADAKKAVRRQVARTDLGLQRAMWDLSIELFGYPMDRESLNATRDEGRSTHLLRLVMGFIDRETGTRLIGQLAFHRHEFETVETFTEGILLAEDTEQINAVRETFRRELGVLLGPQNLDELLLRLFVAKHYDKLTHAGHGFAVPGSRFRTLVQIQSAPYDLPRMLLPQSAGDEIPDPKMVQAAAIELARELGAELYGDWARAQDERFQKIYELGRENSLAKEDSIKIFNALDTADTHLQQVRADTDLEPEEVILLLAAVQARALATFRNVISDKVTPAIRRELGKQLFDHLLEIPELKEENSK